MNYSGKKVSSLMLALVLTLGLCGTSLAANGDEGDYNQLPYGPQLTKEQMDKAQKIFNDNYASMNTTRKALTAKRAQLDAELASQTPDRAKIENLSREIGDLRGKMLSARVAVRAQLEEAGLPADFYGPNPAYGQNMPRQWGPHHGQGRHHGRFYGGPMGPMGMMGGPQSGWCGGRWQ